MSKLVIRGGHPIEGVYRVQGAKNAALPILAAAILAGDVCRIENCPDISDVAIALRILNYLGAAAKRIGDTVELDTRSMNKSDIPEALMRQMRSSVMFLGAILGRMKEATISFPGGCELGPRPIDLHISSMERLGAVIREDHGDLHLTAKRLYGSEIVLSFPSVGATENVMLAAATAEGTTVLTNAAQEPEIQDLQQFLNAMGARISGAGQGRIVIEGVEKLHGAVYRVMPDRIVAATYLAAAAISGGTLELQQVRCDHLSAVLSAFEESGCKIKRGKQELLLTPGPHILPVKLIRTMPYPAFPTDALAPMMAYLSLAKGNSLFVETIFQSRYRHAGELQRMGAQVKVESNIALVTGVRRLYGAQVEATDLRGGAALMVAAFAAGGETQISEACNIARGYEAAAENFRALGAEITDCSD